jgi:DeoR family transcriptional regulator of aga operon
LFLAADGVDTQKGITTHYEPEALLNRLMPCGARNHRRRRFSKFGRVCLHKILEPRASLLVTMRARRGYARRTDEYRRGGHHRGSRST